jgi:hypothetical protein
MGSTSRLPPELRPRSPSGAGSLGRQEGPSRTSVHARPAPPRRVKLVVRIPSVQQSGGIGNAADQGKFDRCGLP